MSPNVVLSAVQILCPFYCFHWSDQLCISYTCYILRHIRFAVLCTQSPGGYSWEFLVKVRPPGSPNHDPFSQPRPQGAFPSVALEVGREKALFPPHLQSH